ncbi:MucB/RseB-like sigma(E) regulatory protein [Halanaerobium saccharolyticum]|jgi:negative regulator of sigma E activity|uniref:MucB/RseB-like sigma(E) regulatory protein n=1 Tax=Halanaerobium saccharolyticum TaxID=43595 RepID=A0A4R7YY52_9FIRM|nr:outer membrane lipoprotein-sorting protein [Halanaerobium saccharolyticum]RAK07515.1 MucB/RseB-like sigma(E) regulatory protein [Halanaerobium saccharolyticum]TDW03092.1 MucB/RseB-like sigma(E) regulatory protein [Halanaerobium saccharolyticum]TDX59388.1 MucB/RseB-like sigma(E) regulatory protein [Halanaerobium saccharolyticum]
MFKAKVNKQKLIFFSTAAVLMLLLLSFNSALLAQDLTADEIINRRDENEYVITAYSEAEMIIKNSGRTQTKTMRSWQDGDNALAEFTNPRDRGTRFLKRDDDLWMFFPQAEDLVKISGHMLEQGMMGSDFSYQDMLESDKLTELYDFELLGEEEYEGRPAYKLEGVKVPGKEVSYYRRVVWIDRERFVGLKEELYAESGRLLKVATVLNVEEIEGRWYPTRMIMENKLRQNTSTEFIVNEIQFEPELPEDIFTLERLR